MDIKSILDSMQSCPCGHEHTFDTEVVEIGSGITAKTGEILTKAGFGKRILLVSDKKELEAADGVVPALENSGFVIKKLIYDNLIYARSEGVNEVAALCGDVDGIISVGTGSCNDICRVAAYNVKKDLAIFATAPSMDGFASGSAPIITGCFKESIYVSQPKVIIADTKILAAAPTELKSAGFGDMVAKYIALVDWKIATLVHGDYFCDRIAGLVNEAIVRITSLCDKITGSDEEAAGAVMEALVFTGLAMKLSGNSRPASGCEHVLSHFWECTKLTRGIWPEFHGKKVGVATVLINRMYHMIAESYPEIDPIEDKPDWDEILSVYGPLLAEDVKKVNEPTITSEIDPAVIKKCWPEIRRIINEELPTDEQLCDMMRRAGAAITPDEVHVDPELLYNGLKYHSYMRYRVTLTRLIPMLNIDFDYSTIK